MMRLVARLVVRCLCAGLVVLGLPLACQAQCDLPGQTYDPDRLAAFMLQPGQLLKRYPNGGTSLSVEVRGFAAAGAATLNAVLDTARVANIVQLQAIGHGLGRAEVLCRSIDPYDLIRGD